MPFIVASKPGGRQPWRRLAVLFLVAVFLLVAGSGPALSPIAYAQLNSNASLPATPGIDPANLQVDEQIEQSWHPAYLNLATGDPHLFNHGVYAWPFELNSIGWSMQSYQDYGGTPYFHHGMDMMKMWGTEVYNRSGGQVINIENYNPGWDLYWEVAVLGPGWLHLAVPPYPIRDDSTGNFGQIPGVPRRSDQWWIHPPRYPHWEYHRMAGVVIWQAVQPHPPEYPGSRRRFRQRL